LGTINRKNSWFRPTCKKAGLETLGLSGRSTFDGFDPDKKGEILD
jgi:hypothetical protein